MPPPRRLALRRIAAKPKSVFIAGDALEVNIRLTLEQQQDLQDLLDFIEQGIPVPDRYYRASTGRRSDDLLIKHNIMHLHLGGPHSDALVYLIQYEDAVMLICVDRHIHLEDHPVGKRFRVDRIKKAEKKMQGQPARDTAEEPRSEQDERPQTPERRDCRHRPNAAGGPTMYTVCVRDHFMIAHSFRGAVFGPAQRLHGATYVVDVELRRPELDTDGVVADIGRAAEALKTVLADLNYRNLDDDPAFAGRNTTTEVLARTVFDRMAARIAGGALGPGAQGLTGMRVTLLESHIAWASYEADLPVATEA